MLFHGLVGGLGIFGTDGFKNGFVLLQNDVDVARHFVKALQVDLDASEQIIVKVLHDEDLKGIIGCIGNGHVERGIGF